MLAPMFTARSSHSSQCSLPSDVSYNKETADKKLKAVGRSTSAQNTARSEGSVSA